MVGGARALGNIRAGVNGGWKGCDADAAGVALTRHVACTATTATRANTNAATNNGVPSAP